MRNEVPLEEWPTYIFTRTFAQRTAGTHDSEISALKAVARRADAAHRERLLAASEACTSNSSLFFRQYLFPLLRSFYFILAVLVPGQSNDSNTMFAMHFYR